HALRHRAGVVCGIDFFTRIEMKLTVCPLCGSPAIQKKRGRCRFNIKGELVSTPVVRYWECPDCGEAFFDRLANAQIDEVLLLNRKRKRRLKSKNLLNVDKS
ncbi:MAG: YgiT-type zinc finger protein, partial [bacterium]